MKLGLPLMENVVKPLVKIVLITIGSTAEVLRLDAGIHKKARLGNHYIRNFKRRNRKYYEFS